MAIMIMIISTLCFIAILAIPVAIAASIYFKEKGFRQRVGPTSGTVTGLAVQTSGSSSWKSTRSHVPVVEYKTKDGRTLTYHGKIGWSGPGGYKIGQEVPLYFDPQDPTAVHMGTIWLTPVMLALVIISFFLVVFGLPIYILIMAGGYAAQLIK